MTKYIIRRVIQSIPTLFGITLLTYMIMVLAPGDPVSTLFFNPQMKPEERERQAKILGVDAPWTIQYLRWLTGDDWMRWDNDGDGLADQAVFFVDLYSENADGELEPLPPGDNYGILRGDFGKSFSWRRNPLELIGERLPATIELNISVLVVGLSIGLTVGVVAAIKRGGLFDSGSRVLAVIGTAIPDFWLGFLLILILGPPLLDIFPFGYRCAPTRGGCPPLYARLEYLVLPTIPLALGAIAGWSRFMRASMLDTINSDYIRTAQAKGLARRSVWVRHGARNAIIPLATFLGPSFVALLGGSVIIERIFNWPGVGFLLLQSITSQDYPVVMASVVIYSVITIIGYLLADIMYAAFDPRVRF